MYLSELNIWNFRKYGRSDLKQEPSIKVNFKQGLNLVVGENDSGKTAIIDAIKYVLGTQSYDGIYIEENDFYVDEQGRTTELKIECVFSELSSLEAGKFLEWITFNEEKKCELRIRLIAKIKDSKIIQKVSAGLDFLDIQFEARDLLRVTYLKPLRDAENELSSGYKSRFAQILKNHPLFIRRSSNEEHPLEKFINDANKKIENYFESDLLEENKEIGITHGELGAKQITQVLNDTLETFMGINYEENNYCAKVSIAHSELSKILSRLMLNIDENKVGLGSLNQLYIAMELLLLEVKENFKMALIEEIEAHLHPQAQLRLIKYIQSKQKEQFIITTHSISLASVVKLENLILCKNKQAFSLSSKYTNLSEGDYEFIERFLDATKSNLFFAKGVIFVEGDAENILLPTLAEVIERPLDKYGVSVVNVGNTAFLRYSNIFVKNGRNGSIDIPISIITDLDVRPREYYSEKNENNEYIVYKIKGLSQLTNNISRSEDEIKKLVRESLNTTKLTSVMKEQYIEKEDNYDDYKIIVKREKKEKYEIGSIKLFTNTWTMEYDIALSSIREYMYAAILIAQKIKTDESVIKDINLDDYIKMAREKIIELEKTDSKELIAYKIYEALLNNKASKAVASQYLSKILKNKNSVFLRNEILTDPYLKYLVCAILYATDQKKGGVGR